MSLTAIRIPERIHKRALKVLTNYRKKRITPHRIRKNGFLSLHINPWWRILSKDGGRNWMVMSHETYNREVEK